MRIETKFVIDYFQSHSEFIESIKIETESGKIGYMKRNLELNEDTDLTQVQCNLFYAAISNVEWNIVLKNMAGAKIC